MLRFIMLFQHYLILRNFVKYQQYFIINLYDKRVILRNEIEYTNYGRELYLYKMYEKSARFNNHIIYIVCISS